MHEASPKIEAYYQYYISVIEQTAAGKETGRICETWVEWRGKGFCNIEELRKDMEADHTSESV